MQGHVALWWDSYAGFENILDGTSLLEEGIHDGRTVWHQRGLTEIRQNGQNIAKTAVFLVRFVGWFELYPGANFGEDCQVQNYRTCQQRVFAGVVDNYGVGATQHDFRGVLVHCTFAVG